MLFDFEGWLEKSHSMPNYLEVPWWPSQISLKLCDCDPCPMKWKSWKFELLTIYRLQDIAIQRLNLFQKIAPHRNFLFLVPFSESNNSFKWCDIKLFFSEVIWDQAYFTKKKKKIISGNGDHFVSVKKNFEKKFVFQILRDQKPKIGCF